MRRANYDRHDIFAAFRAHPDEPIPHGAHREAIQCYLWGACSLSRDYTGCGVLAVAKQSRMPATSRCQLCCGGLARRSHALRRADWKIRSGCSAPGLCALPRQPGLARRPKIGSRCRAPKAAIDLIDQCSLRPRSTELGRRERGAAENARAEPRDERRRGAVEGEGVVSTSVVPCGAPLARRLASSGPYQLTGRDTGHGTGHGTRHALGRKIYLYLLTPRLLYGTRRARARAVADFTTRSPSDYRQLPEQPFRFRERPSRRDSATGRW